MAAANTRPPILWLNVIFLCLTPVLAVVIAPIYVWNHGIQAAEITAMLVLWFIVGQSITAGYHRLFSHRAYRAKGPLRAYFAIVGAAAWQNSVITWASDHRTHHKSVDQEEDPYNPKRGFWYSHIGWILVEGRKDGDFSNVPDLWSDSVCRWQHRYYWLIGTLFNIGVPVLLGLWTGRLGGMLIFALLVRVVMVHHCTFTINSLAHMWGSRPWSTENTARDNWFLSLLSFGEGYHNYHHAYQYDYRNGPLWYNYDPSKWLIWALSHTSLVEDLRRAPDEVILRRRYDYAKGQLLSRVEQQGELSADEWTVFLSETCEVVAQRARALQGAIRDGTATLAEHTELLRIRLRERWVAAESRLESTLKDLQAMRQAWLLKRKKNRALPKASRSDLAAPELEEKRRAFRIARRQAQRALQDLSRVLNADHSMA